MEPCIDRRACPTPWKPVYTHRLEANAALLEVWVKGRDADYWDHSEPRWVYRCRCGGLHLTSKFQE